MKASDSSGAYRPEIDGLRCIAVLAVVLFHAQVPGFGGGFLGVDIFFVISGYLITRIVVADLEAGAFSLSRFYERRARRILPALFVVCALTVVGAWGVLSPHRLREFGRHLVGVSFFVANIAFARDTGYFATDTDTLPLVHTWSLAVEEQFYLLFPPLLTLGIRSGKGRLRVALTALLTASLLAAAWMSGRSTSSPAAFFLLPTRAWELMAGSLLALGEFGGASRVFGSSGPSGRAGSFLSAFGLVLCLASIALFNEDTPHPGFRTLVPVGGAVLVLSFSRGQTPVGRLLASRPLVGVGLISYSLYLYQQPLFALLRVRFDRRLHPAETTGVLVAAMALAWITWRFIEQPFRDRTRVSRRAIATVALGGTAVSAAIGAGLIAAEGAPWRFDAAVSERIAEIDRGFAARNVGIKAGECHWSPEIPPNLHRFLTAWRCLPEGDHPRVLVVGDSTAADKAWVLREAGIPAGNLTGAGCALLPPSQSDEPCARILRAARALVRSRGVDGLVLTQSWVGAVSAKYLHSVLDYWREEGVRVLAFAGMPSFSQSRDRVLRNTLEGIPLSSIGYDHALLDENEKSLQVLRELGVTVVSSRHLLCGADSDACSAYGDEGPLVGDSMHLMPAGTRRMAAALAGDPDWKRWYGSLGRR